MIDLKLFCVCGHTKGIHRGNQAGCLHYSCPCDAFSSVAAVMKQLGHLREAAPLIPGVSTLIELQKVALENARRNRVFAGVKG